MKHKLTSDDARALMEWRASSEARRAATGDAVKRTHHYARQKELEEAFTPAARAWAFEVSAGDLAAELELWRPAFKVERGPSGLFSARRFCKAKGAFATAATAAGLTAEAAETFRALFRMREGGAE